MSRTDVCCKSSVIFYNILLRVNIRFAGSVLSYDFEAKRHENSIYTTCVYFCIGCVSCHSYRVMPLKLK